MGVTFNKENNMFVFDFEHDGSADTISLTGKGYEVEAFGKCFYYGYEFCDQVDSKLRTDFIHYIKFSDSLAQNPNITHLVQKAINDLNDKINLYNYDLVIMPQSSSPLNRYMMRYIYRFAQPKLIDFRKEKDRSLCEALHEQNVLVVDDITTSGSTLNEILRALRVLSTDNQITIFSLLGRSDLMAEK